MKSSSSVPSSATSGDSSAIEINSQDAGNDHAKIGVWGLCVLGFFWVRFVVWSREMLPDVVIVIIMLQMRNNDFKY
jgi:hypothetical protein